MATPKFSEQRRSLLSSQARVQAPWVKVTIGNYTFGVYNNTDKSTKVNKDNFYELAGIQFPNFIQSLQITKINGQVNQYALSIRYPVTPTSDPNFFEKVFSSVSATREIIFSYGDSSMPTYVYKDEKAVITNITQQFDLTGSSITYQISAVSGAQLGTAGCRSFINSGERRKPSTLIKNLFRDTTTGLQNTFTGMSVADLDKFIDGDDEAVELDSKTNISVLDYITYLVSCMRPAGAKDTLSSELYLLTIHDDTTYDSLYNRENEEGRPHGPYFMVKKTSSKMEHSDAYNIDVGFNTSTIVRNFQIEQNENFAIYYDYQGELSKKEYTNRLDGNGDWVTVLAPDIMSKNNKFQTRAEDRSWWTRVTQFPIKATITIQGLLRPAQLMTYVRLNIIFPGGHKHIASGLYIITKQVDQIDGNGYITTLSLTRIKGE